MKLEQLKEASINPTDWMKKHFDEVKAKQKFDPELFEKDGDGYRYDGNLYLKEVSKLMVKLTEVDGNLSFSNGSPSSMENFPHTINGALLIEGQDLTSLKGCPKIINGSLYLRYNKIAKIDDFPTSVDGSIDLSNNQITSLVGIHRYFKNYLGWKIYLGHNPIEEGIIGLLLIQGLNKQKIIWSEGGGYYYSHKLKDAVEILNKYWGKGRAGVMECQEEMIDAGLDKFAEL